MGFIVGKKNLNILARDGLKIIEMEADTKRIFQYLRDDIKYIKNNC